MSQQFFDQTEQQIILDPFPVIRLFNVAIFPFGVVTDISSGLIPRQFCNAKKKMLQKWQKFGAETYFLSNFC